MPTEAMSDAIRAQRERGRNAVKHAKLRLSIEAGVAALDRGDFTEVADTDLDTHLDDLTQPNR